MTSYILLYLSQDDDGHFPELQMLLNGSQARSVYPMMGMAANAALVASGSFVKLVTKATAEAGTFFVACPCYVLLTQAFRTHPI
jgi:hypothetical protein